MWLKSGLNPSGPRPTQLSLDSMYSISRSVPDYEASKRIVIIIVVCYTSFLSNMAYLQRYSKSKVWISTILFVTTWFFYKEYCIYVSDQNKASKVYWEGIEKELSKALIITAKIERKELERDST